MRRTYTWSTVGPLPVVVLCATLAILWNSGAAAQNSRWGANYFPNVTLTTQDGVKVKFYDDLVKGKIVAIDLIYTTCKYACPLETARMAQVQKLLGDRMGKDVFFYSITIDPEHDTPEVLKAYAEKYQAGPGWLFLTGKAEDIDSISKKIGLYSAPNPDNKDGHTPSVLIGNETTGQWLRNSATDNPRFIANMIGNWMNSWRTAKPAPSYATATKLSIDAGEYGYTKHCSPCHTIGAGVKIGPDLAGIAARRDREWLVRFVATPEKLLADRDPTAVDLYEKYKPLQMPNLGLTASESRAIVDYIAGRDAGAARKPSTPNPGSAEANVDEPIVKVGAVLEPYLRIQQALSADTLSGIGVNANRIAGVVTAAGPKADAVRAATRSLASAQTVTKARAAFGTLGDSIMAAVRESKAGLAQGVRVAYCPMAKKYWLQRGDEIRNPFYGKSMLDCGRFVDGIPAGLGGGETQK